MTQMFPENETVVVYEYDTPTYTHTVKIDYIREGKMFSPGAEIQKKCIFIIYMYVCVLLLL